MDGGQDRVRPGPVEAPGVAAGQADREGTVREPAVTSTSVAMGSTPTAAASTPAALPVEVALDEARFTGLRRFIEGQLGWQAVESGGGQLVPPRLVLQDLTTATTMTPASAGVGTAARRGAHVPHVLVIGPDDDLRGLAAVAVDVRADGVVIWPDDRDGMEDLVGRLLARPAPAVPSDALRIGGSAGGVGTTTVALAVAGLVAWNGSPTLVAVRGTGLHAPVVPAAALAGSGVWHRARPLAGVPTARAVRLVDRDPVPEPTDPDVEAFVLDAGVDPEVDVLVCRRDAAALEMLSVTTAGMIVVVGEGPATSKRLRRAAADRPAIVLPWSARVARAGLRGRVPAGLPGAFVHRLRAVLPDRIRSGEGSDQGRERAFGADP